MFPIDLREKKKKKLQGKMPQKEKVHEEVAWYSEKQAKTV